MAEAERLWSPARVRAVYLVSLSVITVPLYLVTAHFWQRTHPARDGLGLVVADSSYVWFLLALPVALNVAGILAFRKGSASTYEHAACPSLVSFRIVTRGTNVEAVGKTVEAVRLQMARLPLFPHLIEVVTDRELPIEPAPDLLQHVVPPEYATAREARFKARALHFALEASPVPDATWLFHLDEETHITPSVIRGIRSAILEEELSGEHRIGQGIVLYHRDLHEHPILTLADSVRTGDDLGRFRFQHRFGRSMFGMHGSFILVRNDVEREVGFDLGPSGSVTEDAWWSLVEMSQGRRSRWVDGYCLEQSTRSVKDFLKQRRRWFVGLLLVCRHTPARRWYRITLVTSILLWGVSWLGWWVVSAGVLATGVRIPYPAFLTGVLSLGAYIALYLAGLELNLDHRGCPWPRRLCWHAAQILLTPVFSLMETAAVIYGIVRPERGFHVVKK